MNELMHVIQVMIAWISSAWNRLKLLGIAWNRLDFLGIAKSPNRLDFLGNEKSPDRSELFAWIRLDSLRLSRLVFLVRYLQNFTGIGLWQFGHDHSQHVHITRFNHHTYDVEAMTFEDCPSSLVLQKSLNQRTKFLVSRHRLDLHDSRGQSIGPRATAPGPCRLAYERGELARPPPRRRWVLGDLPTRREVKRDVGREDAAPTSAGLRIGNHDAPLVDVGKRVGARHAAPLWCLATAARGRGNRVKPPLQPPQQVSGGGRPRAAARGASRCGLVRRNIPGNGTWVLAAAKCRTHRCPPRVANAAWALRVVGAYNGKAAGLVSNGAGRGVTCLWRYNRRGCCGSGYNRRVAGNKRGFGGSILLFGGNHGKYTFGCAL